MCHNEKAHAVEIHTDGRQLSVYPKLSMSLLLMALRSQEPKPHATAHIKRLIHDPPMDHENIHYVLTKSIKMQEKVIYMLSAYHW